MLPSLRRYITGFNDKGESYIEVDDTGEFTTVNSGMARYNLLYSTHTFPTDLSNDIQAYKENKASGLSTSNGTILRIVDMAPNRRGPMHTTLSIDYGIVLEGEIELVLTDGSRTVFKKGDICVQRETPHQWNNLSDTEWARMLFVLIAARPIEVQGKVLKEDLGNMKDVPTSK